MRVSAGGLALGALFAASLLSSCGRIGFLIDSLERDGGAPSDSGRATMDASSAADTGIGISDAASDGPMAVDAGLDGGVPPVLGMQEVSLLTLDGSSSDNSGWAVAISGAGDIALVGVAADDTVAGLDAGSVRVYVRSGTSWMPEATLLAPDGSADDAFGTAVALSADGTRALIGVPADDTAAGIEAGSAHVFVRSGTSWAHEATLVAPDAGARDQFGFAVALDAEGTRAIIGVPLDSTTAALASGSVRVFLRTGTTWSQEAMIVPPDLALDDDFGYSVAVDATASRTIVGAYGDDTAGGTTAGSAHVFVRAVSTWTREALVFAPDGAMDDRFGGSVAMSARGDFAVVGAVADDTATGANTGSARVLARSGTSWSEQAVLAASDGAGLDFFGYTDPGDADGAEALIGAYGDDTTSGIDSGSARVFLRSGTTWTEQATLVAADGAASDGFGRSVALSSDASRGIIGVYNDDTVRGADVGSARVFVP